MVQRIGRKGIINKHGYSAIAGLPRKRIASQNSGHLASRPPAAATELPLLIHENIRGPDYYHRAISLCSNSVGESCLGDGRRAHLTYRGAGEHQSHARADQRQGAGQDEGGVELAGGLDEVIGHDRGEEAETKIRRAPPRWWR